MQYLGGKQRIATKVIEHLNQHKHLETLYEPFVGGCNIGINTDFKYIHCSDIHPDLILMWQALQKGWIPPNEYSNLEYDQLKSKESSALRGFIGFGASFSGKWFGGYARNARGYNYVKNAASSIKKKINNKFYEATFQCLDFIETEWNVKGACFYLDPPYVGTTKYSNKFNHFLFWNKVRDLSINNIVIISEYSAPADFECVLEIPTKTNMQAGNNLRIEKLFQLKN